jgi:hypothetical protein
MICNYNSFTLPHYKLIYYIFIFFGCLSDSECWWPFQQYSLFGLSSLTNINLISSHTNTLQFKFKIIISIIRGFQQDGGFGHVPTCPYGKDRTDHMYPTFPTSPYKSGCTRQQHLYVNIYLKYKYTLTHTLNLPKL